MARARATPPSLPPSPQDSEWHRVGTAVEVNVKALKKVGEKAPQSTKQAWQPATNTKGAASWANAKVRGVPAMVLTERALSGTSRPRASDRVAVYVADNSGYDLERGGSAKTIRLVPLKMQGSRRGGDDQPDRGEEGGAQGGGARGGGEDGGGEEGGGAGGGEEGGGEAVRNGSVDADWEGMGR